MVTPTAPHHMLTCTLTPPGAEHHAGVQGPAAGDVASSPWGHHRAAVPATQGPPRDAYRPPQQATRVGVGESARVQQEGGERAKKETCSRTEGTPKELEGANI